MRFFERNRRALEARGIDPARLPPGQYSTERFPVLHAGTVPTIDLTTWRFTIDGAVAKRVAWTWEEIRSFPETERTVDIHCVTKWSKFDTRWAGVAVREVWNRLSPLASATHVLVRAEQGYTTNLPVADFLRDDNLFAWTYDDAPLEPDHGGPLRLVVPHLYFWKSAKWVRGFTVLSHDEPGFWERSGYHMYGDPFQEQRYWDR